jgi:hypothetical protein
VYGEKVEEASMTYVIAEPCIDVVDRACVEDNERFFTEPLPATSAPLGSPGGASRLGVLGKDTALVTGHSAPAS